MKTIPSLKNRAHFIWPLYEGTLISSLDENLKFKEGFPNRENGRGKASVRTTRWPFMRSIGNLLARWGTNGKC